MAAAPVSLNTQPPFFTLKNSYTAVIDENASRPKVRKHESTRLSTSRMSGLIVRLCFSTSSRFAASGTAEYRAPDPAGGNDREGSFRRGLARPMERRERRREDIQFARGTILVQRGRDLPDCDAQARQYLGIHRGG